jgi:hypothetical protein
MLVAALCSLAPVFAVAQITVDGVLDEPEWNRAQVFDRFYTTEPLTGEPAQYRTEARVYTDEEGIFVGFINYQPPGVTRIQRRFARDAFIQADRNILSIDFDGNGLSGYDFTVGISNSQQDGIISNEKEYSGDWDGTWYSQTSQDEDYWYTEIHVPWTVAPMTRAPGDLKEMRFYFGRFVWDESLRFASPNASGARPTFLSDWQAVEIEQQQTSTLDWFPYLSGAYDMDDNDDDPDDAKIGLDVVWRPNSGTQFTGTINPDFGQVESDDIVVNFSAFETFFEERRPFFTENQALFDSRVPGGDRLIHTRRIGAAPDLGDASFTDILAGGKLTHYGQSLDYGAFAVSEDDEGASDGRDYFTSRVQARIDTLVLGHSLTWADRPSLDREAMVNSIDADWQPLPGGRVRGQLFFSDIDQDANAANGFEDIDEVDNGGWSELSYSPNDEHEVTAYILWYGEDFDMNDMGFLKRNDWFRTSIQYRRDHNVYPTDSSLLNTYWRIKPVREANQDGDQLYAGIDLAHYWGFRSTESFQLQAHLESAHRRDDRITRGNGIARLEPQNSFFAGYVSPRGKDFNYELNYVVENKGTDKYAHEIDFEPSYFVTDKITLGGEFSYTWFDEWLLWDFRSEQLATYETDLYEVNFKIDWYPDTHQEVRVKFQWAGVKSDARQGYELAGNGHLINSNRPVDDFSVSDIALQIRYRYLIAPLSDFYLTYTRGGFWDEDDNREGAFDMLDNAWNNVTTEQILAKIRYRF